MSVTQRVETYRAGEPTQVETVTVETTVEQDNREAIRAAAAQALTANRSYVASTPTAAQTTAQVKALSRQVNGLIRLLLDALDGTD